MSGTHTAGKLIGAPLAAEQPVRPEAEERLPWPSATLVVVLLSGGLWLGIAAGIRYLFF